MTNIIKFIPVDGGTYRRMAIVIFEANTEPIPPSDIRDAWEALWIEYTEDFQPKTLPETQALWLNFNLQCPYPYPHQPTKPIPGLALLLLVMLWMAFGAGVGAWLAG